MAADGRPSCPCHGGQQRCCSGEAPGAVRGPIGSGEVPPSVALPLLLDARVFAATLPHLRFPLDHARPRGCVHISPGFPRSTMKRFLVPLSALAVVTAAARAQCFESNLGVLMPHTGAAVGYGHYAP